MAKHITTNEFETLVLKSDKPVIVDFYADWCGPCKMLAPIMEQIAAENPDINVYKVDVDKEVDLARKFNVMSIPTVISFKDGKINKQALGYMPKDKVLGLLK